LGNHTDGKNKKKNSFAIISKNLARYRSENIFICKLVARMSKFFCSMFIILERLT